MQGKEEGERPALQPHPAEVGPGPHPQAQHKATWPTSPAARLSELSWPHRASLMQSGQVPRSVGSDQQVWWPLLGVIRSLCSSGS